MEDVRKVASYICLRYQKEFGEPIDEMKLHKLLYLAQRECIIQTGEPLFRDKFEAWRYGPVLVSIRHLFRTNELKDPISKEAEEKYKTVFDKIFSSYAKKSSWSLSVLTHGEYSWRKAREGYEPEATCSVEMKDEDIKVDAQRIKERRALLKFFRN